MRRIWSLSLLLMLLGGVLALAAPVRDVALRGDYVEARTASVFAGACHYNGELVTTGRDAVLAWNVAAGSWQGVDLTGVRAVAVVSADANLSEAGAARRSELVVDSAATDAQAQGFVRALEAKYAAMLGTIVKVRRAPVSFTHEGKAYTVSAPGIAALSVQALPHDECCRMPNLVWYEPLVRVVGRKVGYTARAAYAGGALGDAWQRAGENSAFYGNFSF